MKKTLSHHKVRTSQHDRTLDSMFPILNPSQVVDENISSPGSAKLPIVQASECNLTSILQLRDEIALGKHEGMTQLDEEKHNGD